MNSPIAHLADLRRGKAVDRLAAASRALQDAIGEHTDALLALESERAPAAPAAVDSDDRLTIGQVVKRYNICRETLRTLVRKNAIPVITMPGAKGSRDMIRFSAAELDRHFKTGQT